MLLGKSFVLTYPRIVGFNWLKYKLGCYIMINYKEISSTGEDWELFTRDFLIAKGFYIESPPDRGADGGKDIIITEDLTGALNKYRFCWLVSCKHFAHSNKSVSESDEPNILERIKSFKADGFIGFYSTLPSAGLNTRLNQLRSLKDIKDYRIFDSRLIESELIKVGFSNLLQRYFPESYKIVKPLQLVFDNYLPIKCVTCGKDLLLSLFTEDYEGNIIFVKDLDSKIMPQEIEDILFVCKGDCGRALTKELRNKNKYTSWNDISDIVMPPEFIRFIISVLNQTRDVEDTKFSDKAFSKLIDFIMAISQKVLRSTTEQERERFKELLSIPPGL